MMQQQKNNDLSNPRGIILLLIAFLEGAAVMAAELLGAKMVAPFFGTTIYSWAAVLAVTLFGLAAGYYTGGWLTTKHAPKRILFVVLLLSGFFLLLMPFASNVIMKALLDASIITGLIISLLVFMFPPVFLFGMVSPAIIHALVHDMDDTGKMAGRVYAISTVGGVLNTLLLGFYIIPQYGIKATALVWGIIVLLMPLLIIRGKRRGKMALFILLFITVSVAAQWRSSEGAGQRMIIQYASEGLLGQVKVVDIEGMLLNDKSVKPRGLLVNNTWQTIYNRNDGKSLLDYVYFITPLLKNAPADNKDALLVGLGGGMLAREMLHAGYSLDVVEIDKRLEILARRYFDMKPGADIIIDDGRHYIEKIDKEYGVIVLDAFLGENAPWHLLTKECFSTIKSKLSNNGMLIIEFFGFTDGVEGRASRSIYKTLHKTGFEVTMIKTRKVPDGNENLIIVGTKSPFSLEGIHSDTLSYFKEAEVIHLSEYQYSFDDVSDAIILTDDLPALEIMLAKPAINWRKNLNEVLRDHLIEEHYPIYY
ncbi:MAG: fused MFS/spermidine synthase [Bacteroidales bacterium]|nr:fused MFS/spermidine synthase [Bacteroidales bacterium]